jgi:hypothetical protein
VQNKTQEILMSESKDIFGIRPWGEAANELTKAGIRGASEFLSRICLPAAEEFGLMIRDKVGAWRATNLISIAQKAEKKSAESSRKIEGSAHPRIVHTILENGSWTDDDVLQDMWAGILSASAIGNGADDENLIFINILSQLTISQAKIINYACQESRKGLSLGGWLMAGGIVVSLEELIEITGLKDQQRLDRELDHLRSLELIKGGFSRNSRNAEITPLGLALHLFAKCNAPAMDPIIYYNLETKNK